LRRRWRRFDRRNDPESGINRYANSWVHSDTNASFDGNAHADSLADCHTGNEFERYMG